MNAFYEDYVELGDAPARTTVEVSAMNNGYLIEVEAIAAVG
jgi:enamine deaminase RidA (YjgF/YER057c/UK114 family)